jgi:N-acetylglucosamine kinase-like BadF-type ATPase
VGYFAGIDGGQSSTVAVVLDEGGRVRGRGTAGPADHVDEAPGSRKLADACAAALARALEAAGLARDTRFEAVHAGVSGFDGGFDGAPPSFAARSVRIEHDAPVALAGAVQTRPAVVVIAGTGSVAYGEDESGGTRVRVGGWGYLFGDEGSAFAVARDALAHAMAQDDRGVRSPLGDAALAFFDRRDLRALATAALQGRIGRSELAAFARVVHDAARLGDPGATAIVDRAADALADLAALAVGRLRAEQAVTIGLSGGAFRAEAFAARVRTRIRELVPGASVTAARYDPAVGAALLAFADAGRPAPARVVEG